MHLALPTVAFEHTSNAASLFLLRRSACNQPAQTLKTLQLIDERLAAHLDGLVECSPTSTTTVKVALESVCMETVFVATVHAVEVPDARLLEKLLMIANTSDVGFIGVASGFAWVSPQHLQKITKKLLESTYVHCREIGIATCASHRVNPGNGIAAALCEEDSALRAQALRTVGDLGLLDSLRTCIDALTDSDVDCAYEAARSATLLGERYESVSALRHIFLTATPWQKRALDLLLKLQAPTDALITLKALAQDPACIRLLIQGVGTAGNPHYVPWLIQQMQDSKLSRLAGESFSYITGLDLAYLDLERKPPEGVDFGPNDDPNDDNVAMDEDDGLPWPDVEKVSSWWQANGQRFAPGTRYFMGEPPSAAHCLDVLKNGFQRQRMAAAIYLCLLKPGTPLFNCAAPAWRQQRLLAKMGA